MPPRWSLSSLSAPQGRRDDGAESPATDPLRGQHRGRPAQDPVGTGQIRHRPAHSDADLLRPPGGGVSVYCSLLVSALISAAPTVVGLFRRKVNAPSAYFTTMVLGSVAVSLVAGST